MILTPLFALYLGQGVDMLAALLAPALVAVLALGVVAWAAVRPDWHKARQAALAIVVGGAAIFSGDRLRWVGTRLYFTLEQDRLNSLTQEILSYRKISGMSDGMRHFKELNGELVAYSPEEIDTLKSEGFRARVPLDSILRRDRIAYHEYEHFRGRLRRLRVISFSVTDDYVAFVKDGFLDNLYGFVYVRPGRQPPSIGDRFVDATELVYLVPLANGWYYYATT